MRLLPAHIADAKEMARGLCDSLYIFGLTSNAKDLDAEYPGLQQTFELMSKAMGYESWRELRGLLAIPHEPVYIDTVPEDEQNKLLEQLVKHLAHLLGFDYAHGLVFNAVTHSGLGFTPKARRDLLESSSPWGPVEDESILAEGVRKVSTPSHGGILLSENRIKQMPEHLRYDDGAYEEDGEYHLVAFGFPDEAESMGLDIRKALCNYGMVDTPQDGNDKMLSEKEVKVLSYLTRCIHLNRLPLRFPTGERPEDDMDRFGSFTLKEWLDLLDRLPTTNGEWATRPGPWFQHWGMVQRQAERQAAMEKIFNSPNGAQ